MLHALSVPLLRPVPFRTSFKKAALCVFNGYVTTSSCPYHQTLFHP